MKVPYLVKVLDCLQILKLVVIFFLATLSKDTPPFLQMMVKILFKVNSTKPNYASFPHNESLMIDRCYFSLVQ